jgi:hypothetical protein
MVRAEAYLAITSNSVQFGARVEILYGVKFFNVFGFVGLDVLIQFNPFLLIAEITAMFGVRSGSDVLFGIRVTGTLKGPTPWSVRGEASFEIGFIIKVRLSANFEVTTGETRNTILPAIDVIAEIARRSTTWQLARCATEWRESAMLCASCRRPRPGAAPFWCAEINQEGRR